MTSELDSYDNDSAPYTDVRPNNVGILAIEVYFPRNKVDQAELEKYDHVPAGKYTIGLGQTAMSFIEDQEDVVSMSLTVVHNLMEKYEIEPSSVGRLEVGTESSVDRSKSVKSFLMSIFRNSGNSDIQGVDCINACYGGTAALFNAVNWVESRSWDGRTAIVVAADVAVYASGPARPSGGCGAVAMLIGPNAPLVLEPGCCAAHMDDVYDFYKPAGIFPQVQGKLSIQCYLTAVDKCYSLLCQKIENLRSKQEAISLMTSFSLADVDYCVMHAPFSKMVKKGFARLMIQDCLREGRESNGQASTSASISASTSASLLAAEPLSPAEPMSPGDKKLSDGLALQVPGHIDPVKLQAGIDTLVSQSTRMKSQRVEAEIPGLEREGHVELIKVMEDRGEDVAFGEDREFEKACLGASAAEFERKAAPGILLGRECGNMYAASVHASLASLVFEKRSELEGKRILASSFGSGLAASIFCIRGHQVEGNFSLENIASQLDLKNRLAARRTATPEEFTTAVSLLESLHGTAGYVPRATPDTLNKGSYYLQEVDERFRRRYARKA